MIYISHLKTHGMNKSLLLAAFIFIFSGIKAQIQPIEYPSGTLSEDKIEQILESSRQRGANAKELQKADASLHKQLRAQQDAIANGTYNQRLNNPPQVNATACVNPGFETGNTTGWTFMSGSNSGFNLPCPTCITTAGAISNVVNNTSTFTGQCTTGQDIYGLFSVVAPAPNPGSYSLLLNDASAGFKMQEAQYSFVVNNSTDFFTFQYAVVLQSGGHPPNEQPYFSVNATDVTTGSVVPCTAYSQNAPASGSLAGWSISALDASVYTKAWTTVSIDLSTVIGHTVTVDFTVSDCNQGGHFGYCYIDANCGSAFSASNVSGICGAAGNITLNGPPGYINYQWYGPNPPYPIIPGATASTYTVSSAAATDTFKVVGTFAAGCVDTFNIVVKPILNISAATSPTCRGSSVGTATVTAGTGDFNYFWSGPSGTFTTTTTSQNNLPPGTYTIIVNDGTSHCPNKDTTITISLIPPTLQTYTAQFCGSTPTLAAPNGEIGFPYAWYNNSNTLIAGVTTQTNTISGAVNGQHYTVTYLDSATHCEDSVRITLNKTTINFAVTPQNPCAGGDNGALSYNNNTITNLYSTYNWVVSGATSSSGTTASSTSIYLGSLTDGTYTMIVSAPGNPTCCDTITTVLSSTATIVPSIDSLPPYCNMDKIKILNPTPNVTHSWTGVGVLYGSDLTDSLIVQPPFTVTTPGFYNYTDSMHSTSGGCLSITKYLVRIKSFKGSLSVVEKLQCHNDSIGKIKASVTSETNGPISSPDDYTFTWSPSSLTTTTATGFPCSSPKSNLKGNVYTCTISNGNCIETYTYNLVNPPVLHTDTIYAYYCPKDSLALLIADTGHTVYHWHWLDYIGSTTKDSLLSNTNDSLTVPTQNINNYFVTYKDNGCADTGRIIVSITTHNAFVPNELVNVFSPNGDNTNDVFYPFYQKNLNQYEIAKQSNNNVYELKIYDRWGTLMFETTDYSTPWNGKTKSGHDADAGTYFYYVTYESNCATNADKSTQKGFVELTR
jgi:gliding motility-associated-like protein